jgi:secreted PhoX family phosphatase
MRSTLSVLICAAVMAAASAAALHGFGNADFGLFRDNQIEAHSEQLFGVVSAVDASSTESIGATDANADPTSLVTLAKGLRAHVLSAVPNLAPNIDQMVLWPNDQNPTHLIVANEEGAAQPAVQRIRLSDGLTQTILSGASSGDPVRRTPWGTILFAEENGADGWLIEIADPLTTTGVTFNRATGVSSDPAHVVVRPAPGRLSWEGIALYPNGVMYYADENRPLTGTPGGAYFKFIPATPWNGQQGLANSPLGAGSVYGLRLGKRSGNTDYGQATQTGLGTWVFVTSTPNANLRAAAATLKLTGYYRPEDFDIDPVALADGNVRFCANNTGNEGQDHNWGETICITDGTLAQSATPTVVPEVQYLVMGSADFAMMDNIAYQFGRGNWIIHEDGDGPEVGRNNDLWSCLDDGDDVDTLSDGCMRIGTLNDLTAEWTGGVFDKYGTHFYVSIQHNVTGHGVVLDITGWR